MSLWSLSISFRLGLGFHALNNEGADGSNLMQPRRIDVGETTYDGISGEIVRRHILENFVGQCQQDNLPLMPMSAGLHPDRGPLGIRHASRSLDANAPLTSSNLHRAVRRAVTDCALLDVGGFLAAFGQDAASDNDYIAERPYIDAFCAPIGAAEPIKRESCFDVGWLISEEPQDLTVTQHSAFRDTTKLNSRYAQTMRSNIYGGVIRADLHRIGVDDLWYLQPNAERLTIAGPQQLERQQALVRSIVNFLASPTGARVAAWAPHCFLVEGVVLLTSARTAPFVSPLKVDLSGSENSKPVSANTGYEESLRALANGTDTWAWTFQNLSELLQAGQDAANRLAGVNTNGQAT